MALPDGTKPPEQLRTAFEQFLAAVPDDRILTFVRGGEVQPRGFRVTPKSVPRLRTWLLPLFFRSAPVPETLVRLAREHAPLVRGVSTLSIEALESLLPWMERLAGKEPLLGAMLLDAREEVREAARKRLREEDVPEGSPEKRTGSEEPVLPVDTARKMLAKRIAPLFDLAGTRWVPDTEEAHPPPADGQPPEDGGREKRRRHAVERHCRELSRRLEEKDAQAAELQTRMRRLEETGQRTARNAETLGEELARLRREYTERVASEVENRLRDAAFAWLAAPRELEQALAVPPGTLLERTGEILARQAEHDRHYGNLAQIEQRLEALACARRKIRRARREALRPLPGLDSIEQELSREIERLTEVFPDPGSGTDDGIFERLAAGIRGSDAAGLAEQAWLLEALTASGALTGKQAAGLEGVLREVQQKSLAESWLREDPKNARPDDPTWQLERALAHGQRLQVLVDGHNCLFGLRARYQACFDAPDRPGARAREALVEDLRTMVSNRPDCRIRLYFDGPERSETGILPNLRMVYSGGGDREHRADRVLLDYLGYLRQSDSGPVVVVSNDADIRFKSRGRGAVPCSPAELESFFRN